MSRPPIHPSDPIHLARAFLASRFMQGATPTLVHAWDTWHRYTDAHSYSVFRESFLTSEIGRFLDGVMIKKPVTRARITTLETVPLVVTRAVIGEVLTALQRITPQLEGAAPMWTDPHAHETDPKDLLPCDNGFLNLRTFELEDATPELFTLAAVPVPWLDDPPTPTRWLEFLDNTWPDDPDAIRLLRQMFGYLLTFDTSAHKSFMLIGAPRSGKGTINRVLKALLGESYVGITLEQLGQQFGLAPLIGKKVGAVGDARLSNKSDAASIVERILSISGEDAISVDRKNRDIESMQLGARFLILTNEVPRLHDASGAFVNRFMLLHFAGSVPDEKQDHDLTRKLVAELPGIFKWAIEGLIDLRKTNRFVMPASSRAVLEEFIEISSPITLFVQDACVIDPERAVDSDQLFHAYEEWCEGQGRDHVPNKQTFTAMLRAAFPRVTTMRARDEKMGKEYGVGHRSKRKRMYCGIALLTDRNDEPDPTGNGDGQGTKYII